MLRDEGADIAHEQRVRLRRCGRAQKLRVTHSTLKPLAQGRRRVVLTLCVRVAPDECHAARRRCRRWRASTTTTTDHRRRRRAALLRLPRGDGLT